MADLYLGKFKWGKSFLDVNRDVLALYAQCKNSSEIVAAQTKYLQEETALAQQRKGWSCKILKFKRGDRIM